MVIYGDQGPHRSYNDDVVFYINHLMSLQFHLLDSLGLQRVVYSRMVGHHPRSDIGHCLTHATFSCRSPSSQLPKANPWSVTTYSYSDSLSIPLLPLISPLASQSLIGT